MNSFRTLIDAFSDRRALAAALEIDANRIAVFKRRDSIPPAYWRALIDHARAAGVPGVTADALADLAARAGASPEPGPVPATASGG